MYKFREFERNTLVFIELVKKNPFTVPKSCTRWKTKRGMGTIFFRADNYSVAKEILVNAHNYAVAKEILVNKYCTKVKVRASISERNRMIQAYFDLLLKD